MGGHVGSCCCSAMAPKSGKRRPEELLCFFGTKDPARRRAIAHSHARADFV